MPALIWDNPDDRIYESGLDRGVLYLPDGSAVPWNGLTSIIEKFDKSTSPIYYDGTKVQDLVVLGDFSATMKAVTYPDEFTELEGVGRFRAGMFVSDQVPQMFGLSYRNKIGDGVSGDDIGYKIHLLYNVTAIPSDKTYASISDQPSLVEFEWTISAVPEEIPGFRPTAHLVFDSRKIDPWLLEDIEEMLYGSSSADAALISMPDLTEFIETWYRVKIIDNGDGTWTAISAREGFIFFTDGALSEFKIVGVNATYLDDETFVISDTTDVSDVPQIRITVYGDGSWTADTDQDNLIFETDGEFQILNATVVIVDADTYTISDTVE